jgi:hypothetical protein
MKIKLFRTTNVKNQDDVISVVHEHTPICVSSELYIDDNPDKQQEIYNTISLENSRILNFDDKDGLYLLLGIYDIDKQTIVVPLDIKYKKNPDDLTLQRIDFIE